MGIIYEDAVEIKEAEGDCEHTVITVNCPDKTGLGCDLCRIILLFGISISRGGSSLMNLTLPFQLNFSLLYKKLLKCSVFGVKNVIFICVCVCVCVFYLGRNMDERLRVSVCICVCFLNSIIFCSSICEVGFVTRFTSTYFSCFEPP